MHTKCGFGLGFIGLLDNKKKGTVNGVSPRWQRFVSVCVFQRLFKKNARLGMNGN